MAKFEFVAFNNNVVLVNTTPHPVTIQDAVTGELVTVNNSCLINAKPVERQVDDLFFKTDFVGNDEGNGIIQEIKQEFDNLGLSGRLVIVGSIIAAQGFPGEVAAMVPVPGFERVAPAEKRMRSDKFTIF